jgi:hypothetical protein
VPERSPRDSAWRELCEEVGVVLIGREEISKAPALARERAGARSPI